MAAPATDAGRRHGRLPDRHRRRSAYRPRRAASWRGRHAPGSRRLPVRARQRERSGSSATPAGRSRSARPGRRPQPRCRPSRSVTTTSSTTQGEWTGACADDRLVRPRRVGRSLRGADRAAAELVHALDALQRLGPVGPARPARIERPALLPRAARSSSGGSSQAAAALVHARRRAGSRCGSGAWASRARTHRRRLPGDLPDQPGRQQAPDARRRAEPRRDYEDIALRSGVTAHARTRATSRSPRRHGIRRSRTSTTTASRSVREQGQRRAAARLRHEGPEQPPHRPGRRDLRGGGDAAGIVDFGRPAARRWSTSTATGCRTSSRSSAERTSSCGATSGRATRRDPAPMGHWLGVDLDQDAPNHDAIGAWIDVRAGDVQREREVTVGGGHASGQLVPDPFRPRRRDDGRGAGDLARRRGRAVAAGRGGPRRPDRARRCQRREPLAPSRSRGHVCTRVGPSRRGDAARLRTPGRSTPDAARRRCMPRASSDCASAWIKRGYDRLVVYADREHSANLAWLTGFDPRFEEAILIVGADRRTGHPRRQRVLRDGRRRARCRCDVIDSRTSACRASRATGRDRSPRSSATRASRTAHVSASSAGSRTRDRAMLDVPSFLADELRRLVG